MSTGAQKQQKATHLCALHGNLLQDTSSNNTNAVADESATAPQNENTNTTPIPGAFPVRGPGHLRRDFLSNDDVESPTEAGHQDPTTHLEGADSFSISNAVPPVETMEEAAVPVTTAHVVDEEAQREK